MSPASSPSADRIPVTSPPLIILLVEDNLHNRLLFSTALRRLGHRVIEASSGEKALLVGTMQAPDLILLDIGLPGVSGLGVAEELRAQPDLRRCPIIAVTGMELSAEEIDKAGIDEVIYKPIKPFELAERVTEWWARHSESRDGA